ncbi:MAG: S-formylglutathione hydrolase [Pseudomonadota bacterium]
MKQVSAQKIFGGTQAVYMHASVSTGTDMAFSVFTPPPDREGPYPTLFWLSGLTCSEQNFITKSGFQRIAAQLGLMLVGPDTSPRGDSVPDDPDGAYDFGLAAGFYCDATEAPWSQHYKMYRYVAEELPALIAEDFPSDISRTGILGHSMGGHGALTLHLKKPEYFKTCSAFAPIVAPSQVPWGKKAFTGYLGADTAAWADYDATALVEKQPTSAHILIDQGASDAFLTEQLRPDLFTQAAERAGQAVTLRMQQGYDHSFYFIASFIEDHLKWHAERL